MCVLRNMFVSLSCVDDCNVHVSCVTIRMCVYHVLPYACACIMCYHTHVHVSCVTIRMCVFHLR